MSELQEKLDAAIWSAHTLFQKGLVGGSTGNISFLHEHRMYISRSGSCFGRLRQEDFAQVYAGDYSVWKAKQGISHAFGIVSRKRGV